MRSNRATFEHESRKLLGSPGFSLSKPDCQARYLELQDKIANLDQMILRAEESERRWDPKFVGDSLAGPVPESRTVRPVDDPEYRQNFLTYLRTGIRTGLSERRDVSPGMAVGSPTASIPTSVLVPQGFVYDIEVALKYYGPMLAVSKILNTDTGQPLPYPTVNDVTVEAELVGEGAETIQADVTPSNIIFGAWKLSTKIVKVSLELLQDSAFDLESFLKEQFAIRLGRKLNTLFTTGDGEEKPTGFLTAATASDQTVTGDDNSESPDPTTEIGYLDLVGLEHSVDRVYRKGAIYQAHDSTVKFLQQLKDKYGRPLFTQPNQGEPLVVNGYPLLANNDMDTLANSPATERKTLAFGNFEKYLIRRVKELTVLRLSERYAEYGQVGFIGFARYDGNLLDAGTHPIKYLVSPAS